MLTSKELTALEEQLSVEKVLIKKYRTIANNCTDKTLKSKCEEIATKHQNHYNKLLSYLE